MKITKPYTYVDDDGIRYYNIRQAAKIIAGVSTSTLWMWAKKGVTSFGFEFQVTREPFLHKPDGYRHDAATHRQSRMLIPEADVISLKEIMTSVGRTKPDPSLLKEDRDNLVAASRQVKRRTASSSGKHFRPS